VSDLIKDRQGRVSGVVVGGEQVRARLVVGADGLRSRIARLLNAYQRRPRVRKVSLTAHVRGVPDVNGAGEMHVMTDGCLGIARVESGCDAACNVTLVTRSDSYHHGVPHEAMRAGLRRFKNRDLSELITDDVALLASGPFDWPTRQICFDGAALVGDAAGYFDPFTGQGIYQAMVGAQLLADCILEDTLAAYQPRYRALLGQTRRLQHIVENVCASPFLARALFGGLARSPACAARLTAVTGDMLPARSLFSPFFLTRLTTASLQSLVA
jgi:flavin-dependent dehydrogenase